jgi:hypothetical protein
VQRLQNSLKSLEFLKFRRSGVFVRANETQGEELARKEFKVKALDIWKFFQVLEESTETQEGAQQPSNQAEEKRSGLLVSHI